MYFADECISQGMSTLNINRMTVREDLIYIPLNIECRPRIQRDEAVRSILNISYNLLQVET